MRVSADAHVLRMRVSARASVTRIRNVRVDCGDTIDGGHNRRRTRSTASVKISTPVGSKDAPLLGSGFRNGIPLSREFPIR